MLNKRFLEETIKNGFYKIFTEQSVKAESGDEQENPDAVIRHISAEMAKVVSAAVDEYVRTGDVYVGPTNVQVTSTTPGTPAAVAPLLPAKIQ